VNEFKAKYSQEVQRILAKYPADQKRSAVMPLLYLAQRESGFVTKQDLQEVGELCEISSTDVVSIAGFYTLYHEEEGGKHRIQVCTDLPCALRGADKFLEQLCENLGIRVGETTADGMATVEEVMCLAACDKAPMFQVQDEQGIRYFENQTVASALALVEAWRNPAAAQPEPLPAAEIESTSEAAPSENSEEAEA
jgi:NADH-quinone oxidoreductase subunit E